MAKPLGIVAMLTLLISSGTALAGEKPFTKHLELWGVTNSGKLYLETKQGDQYITEFQHCPVNTLKMPNQSPALAILNMERPRAWFDNAYWFDDTGTPTRTFVVSDGRNGRLECLTGPIAKI